MGIFDNAKSITFNDKEVKSITVDGGVIYEADEPVLTYKATFTIINNKSSDFFISGAEVIVDNDQSMRGVTDSDGKCIIDVSGGTHDVVISAEGYETINTSITVSNKDFSDTYMMVDAEPHVTTQ